ncbi:MAG: hypothetical protein KDC38_21940, partial [Planctomycetes bacterium]|nr:hypothetical protein [Planctomycetota bacterium]
HPILTATATDDASKLVFHRTGGFDLDPEKDEHISEVVLRFTGDDDLEIHWVRTAQGVPVGTHDFRLRRVGPR